MTTSPLKSPEAMSKLKTPEELAEEMHYAKGHLSRVAQEHIARGITYTREHEVKPLVEWVLANAQHTYDCEYKVEWVEFSHGRGITTSPIETPCTCGLSDLLTLYTNNEGK